VKTASKLIKRPLTARPEANGASLGHIHGRCLTCLKKFIRKQRHQTFCSPRCRELFWWAGELAKALRDGSADGLTREVLELARLAAVVRHAQAAMHSKGGQA
jgi:endogenous inhibitor of DNA gyrase (YacG/DUF329 family)